MNFMRGRTFLSRWLILDEAQNLTPKQMKTLITRAGPGTKIVCLGNVEQIDTPYLTETTSGLTYAVDRFKDWAHSAHITLRRGERSRLADYASEVLWPAGSLVAEARRGMPWHEHCNDRSSDACGTHHRRLRFRRRGRRQADLKTFAAHGVHGLWPRGVDRAEHPRRFAVHVPPGNSCVRRSMRASTISTSAW